MSASSTWSARLAIAQGAFYFLTGTWPLLHLASFEAITGPKTDDWLVQTVGALLATFGAVLALAGLRSRITSEWRLLAASFAFVLAVVDITFVLRDVISPIYLADAAVELPLVMAWIWAARADRRHDSQNASCAELS